MPAYIVHKDGVYNIFTTVADGFYFESGLTSEQLFDYIRGSQGQSGVDGLPKRIERAIKNGSSSILGHTLEDLAECNNEGLSVDECIEKYMTLPVKLQDQFKTWETIPSNKPTYKEVTEVTEKPHCPDCGKVLVEETNQDARTMWHLKCTPECGYKY